MLTAYCVRIYSALWMKGTRVSMNIWSIALDTVLL